MILEFRKILLNILFLIVCSLKIQTVPPEPKQVNELKAPSRQQFDNSINTVKCIIRSGSVSITRRWGGEQEGSKSDCLLEPDLGKKFPSFKWLPFIPCPAAAALPGTLPPSLLPGSRAPACRNRLPDGHTLGFAGSGELWQELWRK